MIGKQKDSIENVRIFIMSLNQLIVYSFAYLKFTKKNEIVFIKELEGKMIDIDEEIEVFISRKMLMEDICPHYNIVICKQDFSKLNLKIDNEYCETSGIFNMPTNGVEYNDTDRFQIKTLYKYFV